MDIGKIYGLDEKKETDGIWKNLGDDCELKIACFGNLNFEKSLQERMKPFNAAIKNKTISEDQWATIFVGAIADAILLDWKNVEDGGVKLPYSKDNAIKILTKYRKLRDMVVELSKDEESYRKADIASSEKNFGKSFTGK